MVRALVFLALVLSSLQAGASNFPRPTSLEPAVQFWIKVYTRITTNQGYVHDDENLSVVYATLDLPPYADRQERERKISATTQQVKSALNSLGHGKRSGLTAIESDVLAAWPSGTSSRTFAQAASRVRFQLGQSDRFREGMVRSGQWKPHIREVLARHGLPQELEVLPHVESSFNPSAYSKVAAAGMWQFMPATARQYMRVDHIIDERMDPFIATEGAAKLLKTNYKVTGTWPLALTSYNHGAGGMVRATKAVGTNDIGVIVQKYKGTAFGFASRNFYASFLAALEIDRNPGRYLSRLQMDAPTNYDVVAVQDYISAQALARDAGISLEELKRHNPALLDPVWSGEKYIPQGYPVRIPAAQLRRPLQTTVASLSGNARLSHQKPDRTHRIAPGDSLSTIARRYGTSVSSLMALNGLRTHSIRAGKVLLLPGSVHNDSLTAEQVASTRARLAAGQPLEYVIRSGDSLWSIARRFKVSTEQLQAWNDISAKKTIKPGQKLRIASAG
ncbi:MAG: LysM peptidoglycan-binding domain-containing protein [Halioglobus sp.]